MCPRQVPRRGSSLTKTQHQLPLLQGEGTSEIVQGFVTRASKFQFFSFCFCKWGRHMRPAAGVNTCVFPLSPVCSVPPVPGPPPQWLPPRRSFLWLHGDPQPLARKCAWNGSAFYFFINLARENEKTAHFTRPSRVALKHRRGRERSFCRFFFSQNVLKQTSALNFLTTRQQIKMSECLPRVCLCVQNTGTSHIMQAV